MGPLDLCAQELMGPMGGPMAYYQRNGPWGPLVNVLGKWVLHLAHRPLVEPWVNDMRMQGVLMLPIVA